MLSVLTINHNNSEISFLEKFAFNKDSLPLALKTLKKIEGVKECMILSTCNRVEIYVKAIDENIESKIIKFLSDYHSLHIDKSPTVYQFMHDRDAVYHIFKVASGIDSMIIGEPQIINQIKEGYNLANKTKTIGPYLHKLFQMSLHVAKKVRNETTIGSRSESISQIAIRFSKKIFDDLSNKKALIVGTGEMSQLFADYLLNEKIDEVFIASRDINNAITFADRFRCKPVVFENIRTFLNEVDIIFTSTGSNEFILNKEDFEDKKTSNLFIVDIAIPRDIDPRVGDIDSCFLYGLEDFKKLSSNEKNSFNNGINDAISIINKSVDAFNEWQQTSSAKDTMVALKEHIFEIVQSELKSNSDVDAISAKITNKILHSPFTKIKEDIAYDDFNLKLIQELFDLEPKQKDIQNKVDDKQNKNRN